jgi:hypothetical protein
MAGFGDNSAATFQRGATIAAGGLRVEAGCFTMNDTTDCKIPTNFVECAGIIFSGDGTVSPTEKPDVSGSNIVVKTSGTPNGVVLNYIAVGW